MVGAVNRFPELKNLVKILLSSLPALGDVLVLCLFIFFVFGILGLSLSSWQSPARGLPCARLPFPTVTCRCILLTTEVLRAVCCRRVAV